jgi:hypothetical protein
MRFGLEKLMEEKKVEASSEEIKNVIDEELASLTDKERSDALAHFAPGSDGYASAAWKVKVEKVIAMYLP